MTLQQRLVKDFISLSSQGQPQQSSAWHKDCASTCSWTRVRMFGYIFRGVGDGGCVLVLSVLPVQIAWANKQLMLCVFWVTWAYYLQCYTSPELWFHFFTTTEQKQTSFVQSSAWTKIHVSSLLTLNKSAEGNLQHQNYSAWFFSNTSCSIISCHFKSSWLKSKDITASKLLFRDFPNDICCSRNTKLELV